MFLSTVELIITTGTQTNEANAQTEALFNTDTETLFHQFFLV